jgi:hypothetical protein
MNRVKGDQLIAELQLAVMIHDRESHLRKVG